MNITFHGAAHEVTGSCHLIDTGKKKILLDCGMFQGGDFNEGRNADDFPFDPASINAVLVSHAHNDHSGRIPKLIRDGYTGSIYMTKGTAGLAKLIWQDAYKIMTYNNKKFQSPILFTLEEIDRAVSQCSGVDYHQKVDLGDGDYAIFKDAGHILGASFIEIHIGGKVIAFSGDIGNANVPILKETEQLGSVDVLLCESTYGDRIHETTTERKQIILDLITEGVKRGGTVMIPAFSLERTQELLYELDEMSETDNTLPDAPIFLDSPMAIDALPVYKKHPEYYDEHACKKYTKGNDFFEFPQLIITRSKQESKEINHRKGPKIVIAGAGMMNGGRIVHHLFRYLSDPKSTLIIVGYQARGTLGRRLYEGAEKVKIFGQDVQVKCKIQAIGALSAHGDQNKLVDWIANAEKKPAKVYCVHGEAHAATELAHRIKDDLGIDAFVPELGETIEV